LRKAEEEAFVVVAVVVAAGYRTADICMSEQTLDQAAAVE